MKKIIAATIISLSTLFSAAHATEACESQFKGLYKDIQIYNETEKISEGDGLIGSRLQVELKYSKGSEGLSLKEKIHELETGFAKCSIQLNEDDKLEISMAKEALLKAKNPLINE